MRNPDKHRFLNAIRHIESEDIPILENDPDIVIVNRLLDTTFPLSLHAYELPVPDYVELTRRMGNDMLYFADIWRLGRKETVDSDGRIHYVDGTIKTPACLKDIWFPDLDAIRQRLEQTLEATRETGIGLLCANKSAPSTAAAAMGFEDYWANILEVPTFIHEFHKIIGDYCVRELELFGSYKVDCLALGLGVAMKTGPMCSREILEEFHYPILRDQVRIAKEYGMPVRLHADGDVTSLIPDFIDMGIDLLNPIEPCDGAQDIYEIKRQYGEQIALNGNIDVAGVLARGTPEQVRDDTIAHMKQLAVGGGYVVASSHNLNEDIPLENFYAMRDAVQEYRFPTHGQTRQ